MSPGDKYTGPDGAEYSIAEIITESIGGNIITNVYFTNIASGTNIMELCSFAYHFHKITKPQEG